VRAAIAHAWKAYAAHALGFDELRPLSSDGANWLGPGKDRGLGLTLVDSLDTLWLAGDRKSFDEAAAWVGSPAFVLDQDVDVNVFETTIRVLGGLLSAHFLSGDPVFLRRASELGGKLRGAFASPSGVPYSDVNLKSGAGFNPGKGPSSLAEAFSIQFEFK
jgi:mannosyl-oligosaccharide alpha-1,2-mannosidase